MAISSIPYSKAPSTPSDLCSKLIQQGLAIQDQPSAEKLLVRCSYFRFKAYLHPFKDQATKQFNPGSTFEKSLELYEFDSELRSLLFRVIERIEIGVRSTLNDWITRSTNNIFWYLDSSLFKANSRHSDTISKLRGQFKSSKEDSAIHYKAKYHNDFCPFYRDLPPSWNAFELLTIGGLAEITKALDHSPNVAVLKLNRFAQNRIGVARFDHVYNWLESIRQVRNACGHHSRLFNRNLAAPTAIKSYLDTNIALTQTNSGQDQLNRLYTTVSAMQVIYRKLGYDDYIGNQIEDLFIKYPVANLFRASMGFPTNWKNEKLIYSV